MVSTEDLKGLRNSLMGYVADGGSFNYAILQLATACNCHCLNCYRDSNSDPKIRTLEESSRLVTFLQKKGFIVDPEMDELLPETVHLLPAFKLAGDHEFSTNGESILDYPNFLEALKANGITQLRITLNSPLVHERWSGRNRERAREAVKVSTQAGFYTTVNYIISHSTLKRMEDICLEAVDLKANEVNFIGYIPTKRALNLTEEKLNASELEEFHKSLKELRSKFPKDKLYLDYLVCFLGPGPNPNENFRRLIEQDNFCWAGEGKHGKNYFIDIDNKIYPCLTLCSPEMQIGALVEDRLVIDRNHLVGFNRRSCYCLNRINNSD